MSSSHLFIGSIIHWVSIDEIELITNGFIAVLDGKIIQIGHKADLDKWQSTIKPNLPVTEMNRNQFLLPGFIDCHIHAPQMPNIGLGLDKPLLEWLDSYTFPMEAQYADEAFAADVYEKVIRKTLQCGTTTACYFATNHASSSFILAQKALNQGQRAFVGKVSSNCCCPDFYVESTSESLKANVEFIENVLSLKSDLVKPIITPRFALSCDVELMTGLSKIAKQYDLQVQSHISENVGEVDLVEALFKMSYASAYKSTGLLESKCILAHAVHLTDEEVSLLSTTKTSIAHCPASNTNLGSGFCDVKRLLDAGILVGLGTDVSGGDKVSILNAIRDAVNVSQHLKFVKYQDIKGTGKMPTVKTNTEYVPLNYKQALYLATLGGAKALHLDHLVGNFVVGKRFDGLLIDTERDPIDTFDLPAPLLDQQSNEEYLLNRLQKFVYVGDDRNIVKVFVDGKPVKFPSVDISV